MSTFTKEVNDISSTRKTITVKVPAAQVAEEEAGLIKNFQAQAKVPGFRPGKAPATMVRARYAKELKQELQQAVLAKAHRDAVESSDLEIFKLVDLDHGPVSSELDLTIDFTVDILPAFELPEYVGLKVESASTDVSEKDIDEAITQLQEQRAAYNEIEGAAEVDDYVRCSYVGSIGEQAISEILTEETGYGEQKDTWERAGNTETSKIIAIAEALVGMQAGDTKTVEMEFPEDFSVEAIAGKTGNYSLEVAEVRRKELPEIDASFCEGLGLKDAQELRERMRDNLVQRKQQANAESEREQISRQLLDNVEIEIPQSGIESETELVLRDFMYKNIQQGAKPEDFEENKAELHEGATAAAKTRLKSRFILSKIAEVEKVKVENDDMSRMIMMEAQQSGEKPEKLVKALQKDRSRIDRMRSEIILGKTMDLLLEKCERTPVAEPNQETESVESADVEVVES
jgi:trigger factor